MDWQVIALIALLLSSGFFSGSEIAYVVSNKIKLEVRARKNKLAAKEALYFVNQPQIFFSTILISNNVINIAFASIITVFLGTYFNYNDLTILILSTTLLLFFGELVPKYFARELADSFILFAAIPIRIFSIILFPIVKVTSMLSSFLTKAANVNEESISYLFEKEDIQNLLEESSTVIDEDDDTYDIANKIIDLGDQKIYEVITPRTDIVGIEINSTIEELMAVFIESGYSKIPVYEENIDNIKGVVFSYDMFKKPTDLKSIVQEVLFVPETKKTLEMLNEFLEKRISIAVVVDEFGGTEGIITTEDIIEEMLGEIRDEHDADENVLKQIDSSTFIISGKVEVDLINEEYDIMIPDGDYETIAGYLMTKIGQIPEKGDTFEFDHFKCIILRSDKNKIDLLKLIVKHDHLLDQKNI